jgi:hypothetical protein
VHIEPAIADYIMDLIGVVLYAGAFIIYIITYEKFKKKGKPDKPPSVPHVGLLMPPMSVL